MSVKSNCWRLIFAILAVVQMYQVSGRAEASANAGAGEHPVLIIGQRQTGFVFANSNVAYRKQCLQLTPLGSTDKSVADFIRAELLRENPRIKDWVVQNAIRMRLRPAIVGSYIFRQQPPICGRVERFANGNVAVGNRYMEVGFSIKGRWFGPREGIDVIYVFDYSNRLIDIFDYSGPIVDFL